MNGMVVNSWPYVIAAYAATWTVLGLYALRLWQMNRRIEHPGATGALT